MALSLLFSAAFAAFHSLTNVNVIFALLFKSINAIHAGHASRQFKYRLNSSRALRGKTPLYTFGRNSIFSTPANKTVERKCFAMHGDVTAVKPC